MNELFRKKSLDRLSSPEQLDQLMSVVTPPLWISLAGIFILLGTVIFWGLRGEVATTVHGRGILIREDSLHEVVPLATGRISSLLVKAGDVVAEGSLMAVIDLPDLRDEIVQAETERDALREELARLGSGPPGTEQQSLRIRISQAESRTASLKDKLARESRVISPHEGNVLEVFTGEGEVIEAGIPLLIMEIVREDSQSLMASLYFSPAAGQQIKPGMLANISPTTVRQEEYGYMMGEVVQVSRFPASRRGMLGVLQNEELVASLSAGGVSIMVSARIIPDPATATGFQWSSGKGPAVQIDSGTICTASVVLNRQTPMSLILPSLRRRVLGIGDEYGHRD